MPIEVEDGYVLVAVPEEAADFYIQFVEKVLGNPDDVDVIKSVLRILDAGDIPLVSTADELTAAFKRFWEEKSSEARAVEDTLDFLHDILAVRLEKFSDATRS